MRPRVPAEHGGDSQGQAEQAMEFGKTVQIQEAENPIAVDYEVDDKRPSDSELVLPAIVLSGDTGSTAAATKVIPD